MLNMLKKIGMAFFVIFLLTGLFLEILSWFEKKEKYLYIEDLKTSQFKILEDNKAEYIEKELKNIMKNPVLNPIKYFQYDEGTTKYCELEVEIDDKTYKVCKKDNKHFLTFRKIDYRVRTAIFEINKEDFEKIKKLLFQFLLPKE